MAVRVLFVCLGNICRSPTAHGVFLQKVKESQLQDRIVVDSAGTGAWHVGNSPDSRSSEAALNRGYDLSPLRARQVTAEDFRQFDFILAMDLENLRALQGLKPADYSGVLQLFLEFGNRDAEREVPDPYYGGRNGFEHVLDLVEDASEGLLQHIRSQHKL